MKKSQVVSFCHHPLHFLAPILTILGDDISPCNLPPSRRQCDAPAVTVHPIFMSDSRTPARNPIHPPWGDDFCVTHQLPNPPPWRRTNPGNVRLTNDCLGYLFLSALYIFLNPRSHTYCHGNFCALPQTPRSGSTYDFSFPFWCTLQSSVLST